MKPVYTVYDERWARLKVIGGSESLRDGQPQAQSSYSLELRYDPSLSADMRIAVYQRQTALSSSLASGATTMNIDDYAGMPSRGYPLFMVGGEIVRQTGGHETSAWTVERAVMDTVQASHNDEAAVYWIKLLEITAPPANEGTRDAVTILSASEVEG